MKILFITSWDVYNLPSVKIAEEMMSRGYQVDFYGMYLDDIHIRMFKEIQAKILPISELDYSKTEGYDFIYTSMPIVSIPSLLEINKYIFTFTTCFMDDPMMFGDFTFTQRSAEAKLQNYSYSIESTNKFKVSPGLAVGNPKFDVRVQENKLQVKKQFLFIDAGHFPFGETGKMEVAGQLIKIAEKFPDYKLIIKPRFFPEDKHVTHKNALHIYDCLNRLANSHIPSNICCIKKHVNLEKLVRESMTIITTDMTTSYMDILAYNKNGLIMTGIPSEYSVSHSSDHIRRFINIEKRSGLCVPYTKVTQFLPQGKKGLESHKIEMGLTMQNVSERIVDTMEAIYHNYIVLGRFPASKPDKGMSICMEEVITKRYIKCLLSMVDFMKYRVDENNFEEALNYVKQLNIQGEKIDKEGFLRHREVINKTMSREVLNNKSVMMKDRIKQSYYLQEIYKDGRIHLENEEEYEAKEMYWLLRGKYEIIQNKNPLLALDYFQKFFDWIKNHSYEETLADTPYYMETGSYWTGYCYYLLNQYTIAKKYFLRCQALTNQKHEKAAEYIENIDKLSLEKG